MAVTSLLAYLKSVIGLTISAATVSRVNPPKTRITAYVTGISLQ